MQLQPFDRSRYLPTLAAFLLGTACSLHVTIASCDDASAKTSDATEVSEADVVEDGTAELSVAPLSHTIYPPERPGWIDETKARDGDNVQMVVTSGPCVSKSEADEMTKLYARASVQTYVDELIAKQQSTADPAMVPIAEDWIENELIVRRYEGKVLVGDETQHEKAVLLRIQPEHQKRFETAISNVQLQERLAATGIVILGGFGCLVGGSILLGGLASRQRQQTIAKA
ncbi:hypothetical protein [Rhodopirellula halodulae]|uniref:hypothetical protein n=1 Tax=Rhodopirellula halodulae TaxID=2894198 RepID=UPI001E2AEB98|nr:hypothetical protein [Rhodopirellula sp. JC737]MCC9654418.1 hypothetical protein [Rhodopirellula sp. JC737]